MEVKGRGQRRVSLIYIIFKCLKKRLIQFYQNSSAKEKSGDLEVLARKIKQQEQELNVYKDRLMSANSENQKTKDDLVAKKEESERLKQTLIETEREFHKSCEEIEQEAERHINNLESENEVLKVRLEEARVNIMDLQKQIDRKGLNRQPSLVMLPNQMDEAKIKTIELERERDEKLVLSKLLKEKEEEIVELRKSSVNQARRESTSFLAAPTQSPNEFERLLKDNYEMKIRLSDVMGQVERLESLKTAWDRVSFEAQEWERRYKQVLFEGDRYRESIDSGK